MDATAIPLYGTLSVRVQEQSTSPQPVNVTAADDWRLIVLPSSGCGGVDIMGIALFAGNYTKEDLSRSSQLSARGEYPCLLLYGLPNVYSYDFQPQSASATEAYGCETNSTGNGAGSSPCGCEMEACPPYLMTERAQTQANFSVDAENGDYHYLSPGVYTLVGADEWGAVAILHFVVANPGCPLPQSEDWSKLPFANQQTSVNGTWTFGFGLDKHFRPQDPRALRATASLIDSNLTYESQHPLLLYGRPVSSASVQFISPNGTVAWSYPPSNQDLAGGPRPERRVAGRRVAGHNKRHHGHATGQPDLHRGREAHDLQSLYRAANLRRRGDYDEPDRLLIGGVGIRILCRAWAELLRPVLSPPSRLRRLGPASDAELLSDLSLLTVACQLREPTNLDLDVHKPD